MSEAPTAILPDVPSDDLPLSVLLFNAAMQKEIPLSEFARQLGIGALSLRQFISGQTQRPRSRTLEVLADALGMPVEEVRYRSNLPPTSALPFADWLKDQMNGDFSRARLTRETQISDGALRNYLSGQTLPDTDQAQRLAETLSVDSLELAKILVADQTVRAGGETVDPPPSMDESIGEMHAADGTHAGLAGSEYGIDFQGDGGGFSSTAMASSNEEQLLALWRQLHPQARRATLIYIAGLLAER